MTRPPVALLGMVLSVALTGCSDPGAANAGHFRQVIQQHFDQYSLPAACVGKRFHRFPYELTDKREAFRFEPDAPSYGELMVGLESAGLVHRSGQTYDLTDAGKRAFIPEAGFCYGKVQVDSVDYLSEPAQQGQRLISKVKYTVSMVERPDWSRDAGFTDAFDITPSGFQNTKHFAGPDNPTPQHRKTVLVKTKGQWILLGLM